MVMIYKFKTLYLLVLKPTYHLTIHSPSTFRFISEDEVTQGVFPVLSVASLTTSVTGLLLS